MGNSKSYDNSNRSVHFLTERYISVEPEICIGLINDNGMGYGMQALKYNNVNKPHRLINVYKESKTTLGACLEEVPNPASNMNSLCYEFEDGFKLCFKKCKDASTQKSPIISLENPKENIFINKSMCSTLYEGYKPLGRGRLSEHFDLIHNFFNSE
jgi:hypothetical protein